MPSDLDTPIAFSKPPHHGKHDRSCGTSGEKLARTSICRIIVGTKTRGCSVGRVGKSTRMGKLVYASTSDVFLSDYVDLKSGEHYG